MVHLKKKKKKNKTTKYGQKKTRIKQPAKDWLFQKIHFTEHTI